MPFILRRDTLAGAAAGLVAVLVFGRAMQLQDMPVTVSSLYLLILVLMGASFGATFRYQPGVYAATFSSGLFYGLLLWIVGPLTLVGVMMGHGPTWSIDEVSAAFPSLMGHLLYGGLTGFMYYLLVTVYLHLHPEPGVASHEIKPTRRVVILGGDSRALAPRSSWNICTCAIQMLKSH